MEIMLKTLFCHKFAVKGVFAFFLVEQKRRDIEMKKSFIQLKILMKMLYLNRRFNGLPNKLKNRLRHTNMLWYQGWKGSFDTRAKYIVHDALVRSYSHLKY